MFSGLFLASSILVTSYVGGESEKMVTLPFPERSYKREETKVQKTYEYDQVCPAKKKERKLRGCIKDKVISSFQVEVIYFDNGTIFFKYDWQSAPTFHTIISSGQVITTPEVDKITSMDKFVIKDLVPNVEYLLKERKTSVKTKPRFTIKLIN